MNAGCALAHGCTVSLVTLLLLWFHTRCWPVNISKGLCGLRLLHKGRFQHPGRRRLSENRSLSVQPRMQTIFNTAKIKLREKGAMPGSSSVIIFHIVGPLSPHIMHSMARRKKTRRGEGENTSNNELSVRSYSGRAHRRYKGCKVEQCAYIDEWIYGGTVAQRAQCCGQNVHIQMIRFRRNLVISWKGKIKGVNLCTFAMAAN